MTHDHDHQDLRGQLMDATAVNRFMYAGNATLTLRSQRTGTRFTYNVAAANDDGKVFFISVLVGPENSTDFKYLGRIDCVRDKLWLGRKTPRPGDITPDAPCARAFDWAWNAFERGVMPAELEVWHEARCGRCGRKLTVPESVAAGFGPECAGKV